MSFIRYSFDPDCTRTRYIIPGAIHAHVEIVPELPRHQVSPRRVRRNYPPEMPKETQYCPWVGSSSGIDCAELDSLALLRWLRGEAFRRMFSTAFYASALCK